MNFLKAQNTNQKNIQGHGLKFDINNRAIVDTDSAIKLPIGTNATRPPNEEGFVRYNSENGVFEGNDGQFWRIIDRTSDVDRDTFIQTETTPGNDNDQLEFFTEDTIRSKIDSNGLELFSPFITQDISTFNGSVEIKSTLDVDNKTTLKNTLEVQGNQENFGDLTVSGSSNLEVSGSTVLNDTLKVEGAKTTLNSQLDVSGESTFNSPVNINNNLDITGILSTENLVNFNDTTQATDFTTASVVLDGGLSVNQNTLINGRLGIGVVDPDSDLHVNNDIKIDSSSIQSGETATFSVKEQVTLTSIPSSSFRSGKFQVQAFNTVTGEVQISEILVAHDGVESVLTEYGVSFTGIDSFVDYDTDINSGNVRILAKSGITDEIEYKVYSNVLVS